MASAAAFAVGAGAPVLLVLFVPFDTLVRVLSVSTVVLLAVLGAVAAQLGGASWPKGSARVAFWGVAAMSLTGIVGRLFGMES